MSDQPENKPLSPEVVTGDARPEAVSNDREESKAVVSTDEPPAVLFVIPHDELVLFPGMMVPVMLEAGRAQATIEHAHNQTPFIGVLKKREGGAGAGAEGLYEVGTAARMLKQIKLPDGNAAVVVQALRRFRVERWVKTAPVLIARVAYLVDSYEASVEVEALWKALERSLQEFIKINPHLPDEMGMVALNIEGPARLADFVGANFGMKPADRQELLETLDVKKRLSLALEFLTRELEVVKIGNKIQEDIRTRVEKTQRDYFLREQLKTIRRELGEEKDERSASIERYEQRIVDAKLPDAAEKHAREELRRLSTLPPEAAEYNVIRTYLDWILALPWSVSTAESDDIRAAARMLDEDHYGLEDIKTRVLEFLSVRELRPSLKGSILCFSGPPGTGKTSLGRSIARAMGRKFYRFSLGGMRDEAEIKGHRRTYIGAMPGKLLQALKEVGANNPVLMLDEIDKLGKDWRGDPSSAMLEVLDPEQNASFLDHYLDIPFDLSKVFFIATANYREEIPAPLLDRMEVIDFRSYIADEKVHIATKFLVPKQLEANGLKPGRLSFPSPTLRKIITGYTREAGCRGLEREIAAVCRKTAAAIVAGKRPLRVVRASDLERHLGPPKAGEEISTRIKRPGIAVGLAWTPAGGDVMLIEASRVKGKGNLKLTGKLGDVMNESAQIAMTYVRSVAAECGIPDAAFGESDIHVHFPAGAVPKDGPSAGVAITTCLLSLLWGGKGRRVRAGIAMTGEMTLRGDVLAVGGIREKVIAAKMAGMKAVIIPRFNVKDVKEIPAHVVRGLKFHPVDHYREVVKLAF
ncbi:MAG: endopeptidase La [Deltaproteobacteria bacterium]|nr:endopeptidase La [Deltaproteobacteria bacterium]